MALVFLNTMSREKEEFAPINPGEVKIYTCGPTVYDFPHIGNFRAYAFEDILRRYLKYRGYKVIQVMNITDIDDKIIRDSRKENISIKEFTARYTKAFFEDLESLNIEKAEYYPRATEHITEMVAIIKILLEKGYAYKSEDGSIYYDISKFPGYGNLAHFKVEELVAGARVKQDEYDKERASDFALWKAWDEADGDVFWETDLGKGRPGWHIECSAMSNKYMGNHFDIHTGGVDNIFPHHENEIAQSEAAFGVKFVNYWLHCEHLLVEGQKMSKSLGNFYTLRDLIKIGFSPVSLRYFYISSHYRSKINFTMEAFKSAANTLEGLSGFVKRLREIETDASVTDELTKAVNETKDAFEREMDDDLNTPRALASIFDLVGKVNLMLKENKIGKSSAEKVLDILNNFDRVLGLKLFQTAEEVQLTGEERKLVEEREEARKIRDWKKADTIREELVKRGIILEDRKGAAPRILVRR